MSDEAAIRALLAAHGFRADSRSVLDLLDDTLKHLGAFTAEDYDQNLADRTADVAGGGSWVPLARVVAGALPRQDWAVARNVALAVELAFPEVSR